jgi:hypothetical protein
MGWINKYKSKYVNIDYENPQALGECDRTGFTFNLKDLCKQMEWRGNNLVWTGLMVGRPFLDVPNEQLRPPVVKDDPRAKSDPRPPSPYTDPEYPVAGTYEQTTEELEIESFYNDNNPPYGPPSYVLPYSDRPIPGWHDPNPVPPPSVLLEELRKVRFQ